MLADLIFMLNSFFLYNHQIPEANDHDYDYGDDDDGGLRLRASS